MRARDTALRYEGFWLHRALMTAGWAKIGCFDAQAVLHGLMAHAAAQAWSGRLVPVPTPEEEDARRPHRKRQIPIMERSRHVSRMRAPCARQGILLSAGSPGDLAL